MAKTHRALVLSYRFATSAMSRSTTSVSVPILHAFFPLRWDVTYTHFAFDYL